MKFKEMDSIENEALEGAIAFLIKLPETSFRPLYMKVSSITVNTVSVVVLIFAVKEFHV